MEQKLDIPISRKKANRKFNPCTWHMHAQKILKILIWNGGVVSNFYTLRLYLTKSMGNQPCAKKKRGIHPWKISVGWSQFFPGGLGVGTWKGTLCWTDSCGHQVVPVLQIFGLKQRKTYIHYYVYIFVCLKSTDVSWTFCMFLFCWMII